MNFIELVKLSNDVSIRRQQVEQIVNVTLRAILVEVGVGLLKVEERAILDLGSKVGL